MTAERAKAASHASGRLVHGGWADRHHHAQPSGAAQQVEPRALEVGCSRRSIDSAASVSCAPASSPAPARCSAPERRSRRSGRSTPTEDISEYDEGQDNSLYDALQRCIKPVIAAINGSAHGAGATLALACDLRVMADDAFMVWPMARLGMIPANGTWCGWRG